MATEERPLLSVVMPAYDEVLTITEILRRVDAVPLHKEIIVVDDGSTDGTRALLTRLEAGWSQVEHPWSELRVFLQPRNLGKGRAVRVGIEAARGRITLIQDADLEYDPNDYAKLVQPILDDVADVVYGSRFDGTPRRVIFFWHQLGNQLLTLLSNALTDLNLTDMETCYKAFRTEIIQAIPLEEDRFGFEPEITAKIARLGLRVYEVPIAYYGRTYAEGKKISWRDGVQALRVMLRYSRDARLEQTDLGIKAVAIEQRMGSYNEFLLDLLAPHLGQRVVEVGAGLGNQSRRLLNREALVATDADPEAVALLEETFADLDHASAAVWEVPESAPGAVTALRPDTVLSCNLLQFIEDDDEALRRFAQVLPSGGRLVLLVPAHSFAFGALDRSLGALRRYDRDPLTEQLERAGFHVEHLRSLNAAALPAWLVSSQLLGRTRISRAEVRLNNTLSTLHRLEARARLPVGLSLLAVARRE